MRDAFGGAFMIKLFLVFIIIYVGFTAIALNYAKAYKAKSIVVEYLETNEISSLNDMPAIAEQQMREYFEKEIVGNGHYVYPIKYCGSNSGYPTKCFEDIGIKIERPNFWKTTGQASLQFSQNYFSENWYKGGNNNQNLLASIILQANYNDQRKVSWENKLEMRLGFMTTTSDSCHKFLTSNDKLNLHSKLGVKATKSWYYTITAEANTQFMKGHRSNDKRTYSNFLAPLDVFLSIGMDFKPTFKNGNTFSLALLPLSYKIRHLNDDDENIHSVYNMVGKNTQKDYGSKMELNTRLKIAKDFYWKSRCYYYTSYSYAEAELENSFTYAFSKYINAEVYTLWRFDDNRAKKYFDDNLGYFQFKEYFTLGMTYSF